MRWVLIELRRQRWRIIPVVVTVVVCAGVVVPALGGKEWADPVRLLIVALGSVLAVVVPVIMRAWSQRWSQESCDRRIGDPSPSRDSVPRDQGGGQPVDERRERHRNASGILQRAIRELRAHWTTAAVMAGAMFLMLGLGLPALTGERRSAAWIVLAAVAAVVAAVVGTVATSRSGGRSDG